MSNITFVVAELASYIPCKFYRGGSPEELSDDPTNSTGNSIGILQCLKNLLHTTVKVVFLERCLCIPQVLIELRKDGVFAAVVFKKRRYFPRNDPGQDINNCTKKNILEI